MGHEPQSQAILRAIVESPKDIVIFALDRGYRYMAFNENHRRTMKAIWGVDIEVGMDMLQAIGRDDDRRKARANFDRALGGESFVVVEEYGDERMQRRYYEDIYSPIRDSRGNVVGLTLYLTDITKERHAQQELEQYRAHLEELVAQRTEELEAAHQQLLHAQKLESLGVMAGGIAHDFNNLLSSILGHADVASARSHSPHAAAEQLRRVRSAVLQARQLTDQLLTYAGKGRFALRAVDLSATVRDTLPLLGIALPGTVGVECDLSSDLPAVKADVGQLRQVVMNLVANAAEAIDGQGEITVRTFVTVPDASVLGQTSLGEPPTNIEHVCLEVRDTGEGIAVDAQTRIFDPFYTTKFSGRGLGLAAVLGIVRSHHGTLSVESEVGRGTTMRMLLPQSDEPLLSEKEGVTGGPSLTVPVQGSVLLVDDDDRVRWVTRELLALLGLRVAQAASGIDACRVLERDPEQILLALIDLTMPGLSGTETLQRLREIKPDLEVILQSGYSEDQVRLDLREIDRVQFLHKPFEMDELSAALARAFDRIATTKSCAEPDFRGD